MKQKSTCVVVPPKTIPRESSSGPSVKNCSSGNMPTKWARCVCGSTPPGTTILPNASMTRPSAGNEPGAPIAAIRRRHRVAVRHARFTRERTAVAERDGHARGHAIAADDHRVVALDVHALREAFDAHVLAGAVEERVDERAPVHDGSRHRVR